MVGNVDDITIILDDGDIVGGYPMLEGNVVGKPVVSSFSSSVCVHQGTINKKGEV